MRGAPEGRGGGEEREKDTRPCSIRFPIWGSLCQKGGQQRKRDGLRFPSSRYGARTHDFFACGGQGACAHDLKGAGGDSHAPLRCTKHLCTLGERAQLDSRPCCRCESAVCRPAWAREGRSGGCAGLRRPREVVRMLPSDAQSICAPWGSVHNLIHALAVGANRPLTLPCLGA